MSTETRNRVRKGVSTAGQFAPVSRSEDAGVVLAVSPNDRFMPRPAQPPGLRVTVRAGEHGYEAIVTPSRHPVRAELMERLGNGAEVDRWMEHHEETIDQAYLEGVGLEMSGGNPDIDTEVIQLGLPSAGGDTAELASARAAASPLGQFAGPTGQAIASRLVATEGTLGYGATAGGRYDPDHLAYKVSGGGPKETSSSQRVAITAILDKEKPRNGVIVDVPFPLDPVEIHWTATDGLSRTASIDRDGTINSFLAEPADSDENPWRRPYSIRSHAEGERLKGTIGNALANSR